MRLTALRKITSSAFRVSAGQQFEVPDESHARDLINWGLAKPAKFDDPKHFLSGGPIKPLPSSQRVKALAVDSAKGLERPVIEQSRLVTHHNLLDRAMSCIRRMVTGGKSG
jgi:hypothetical protein